MSAVAGKAGNESVAEARAKMRQHFSTFQGEQYARGWAKLWEKGDFLPWDRGLPSPALADTLMNHRDIVGGAMVERDGQVRRKRALVPGCGRGVDVLLLQSFGYDVVGLEISEGAVKACFEYAKEYEDAFPPVDDEVGRGSRSFLYGDFYKDDWLQEAGLANNQTFDLIYDYTFFCAMNPAMRPAWAQRMSDLLNHSPLANLICLEFPTDKSSTDGGPPFASPPNAYLEHLSNPGKQVAYDAEGKVKSNPLVEGSPDGLERVGHWHPADTHKIGKDSDGNVKDYIAVWRHR